MSLPSLPLEIYLKTAAGRKCAVAPPFTLQRLTDAAVAHLRFERDTVKLYVNGELLNACGGDDQRIPLLLNNAVNVLVVGKPVLKKNMASNKVKKPGAPAESPNGAGRAAGNREQRLPQAAFSAGDNAIICSSYTEKTRYQFFKPLVFMHGRRGLRHLFHVAKNRYGDFPLSLRDHPVMVCIVEYVDRDPDRLKEILFTIEEDEPEFLAWIEANDRVFLNIINTPPQWRDDTSPIWIIRHAKAAYNFESRKNTEGSELLRAVDLAFAYRDIFLEEFDHSPTSMRKKSLLPGVDFSSSQGNPNSMRGGALESRQEAGDNEEEGGSALNEKDGFLDDPNIQEAKMVYRAWELAMERGKATAEKTLCAQQLVAEINSRLCDLRDTLLRIMESYIITPPTFDTLMRFFALGETSWRDGEQWYIEQNDVAKAFEMLLGKLLFVAGKRLVVGQLPEVCKHKPISPRQEQALVLDNEDFSLLDSTMRWITARGPSTLADELLEYSCKHSVSIVTYSRASPSTGHAYVIKDGCVKLAPISLDENAGCELKELESLYGVMTQIYPPKEAIKMRRAIRTRWSSLLGRLYRRLLCPIEDFLPPPASRSRAPLSEVGQVCFIDLWTPRHTPIPFSALWNPKNGASCVLQWALFIAHYPWDLILSAEVPWSSPLVRSPVVTRVITPTATRPTKCVQTADFFQKGTMVTYLNTSDVGCASVEGAISGDSFKSNLKHGADAGGLLQNIPWKSWMRRVLGRIRAGIPTYSSMMGKDAARNSKTALFIYEVMRFGSAWGGGDEDEEVTSLTKPLLREKGGNMTTHRKLPYNQSADLFVSHVVGRDTGTGIHRASLLPTYMVAGQNPLEMYNLFLNALVATSDMTTAKAYRLAMLVSWNTTFKDEPWRAASVMLFNYGGTMKTLHFLHEEYCKRRYLKFQRILGIKTEKCNETNENQSDSKKKAADWHLLCDTLDGRYVEGHGIDVVYDLLLHDLSIARPQGDVAVLDNMIECIQRNQVALEKCVERHKSSDAKKASDINSTVVSVSQQPSAVNARVSFASAIRNMISASRKGSVEDAESSGGPAHGLLPQNKQPPSGK